VWRGSLTLCIESEALHHPQAGQVISLVMKHIERHHSRYTPAQLFDLVADVERYPDFVPWVVAARVYGRRDSTLLVEMTMGTSFLHKRFTATALLDRPHRVDVNSHDPAFERFEHIWTFEPAAEGGTNVEYRVDFTLRSHILQALIGVSFAERSKTMVQAYMLQARRRYGAP
jgi:coenzyme Q-binding protein COQ10